MRGNRANLERCGILHAERCIGKNGSRFYIYTNKIASFPLIKEIGLPLHKPEKAEQYSVTVFLQMEGVLNFRLQPHRTSSRYSISDLSLPCVPRVTMPVIYPLSMFLRSSSMVFTLSLMKVSRNPNTHHTATLLSLHKQVSRSKHSQTN